MWPASGCEWESRDGDLGQKFCTSIGWGKSLNPGPQVEPGTPSVKAVACLPVSAYSVGYVYICPALGFISRCSGSWAKLSASVPQSLPLKTEMDMCMSRPHQD